MAKKTYSDKLKSPKWQKRRLEILARDNFTCQLCSDTETELHIHHHYYTDGAMPWDYPDDALITYCSECHYVVEQIKKDGLQPLIAAKGVSLTDPTVRTLMMITISESMKGSVLYAIKPDGNIYYVASLGEGTVKSLATLFDLSSSLVVK